MNAIFSWQRQYHLLSIKNVIKFYYFSHQEDLTEVKVVLNPLNLAGRFSGLRKWGSKTRRAGFLAFAMMCQKPK